MKARRVVFSPEAEEDLAQIYDWIADAGNPVTALNYVTRIADECRTLDFASERGRARDDVRSGLRTMGFERSATIAFVVELDQVTILRIFKGGRNWETEFD